MKLEQWHIGLLLIVAVLIIISLFIWNRNKNKEGMETKKSVIPLHIYQTWHTKKLPPKMRECVEKLKKDNPEFEHHLYDIEDCRKFIGKHFDKEVLDAYDKLKPLAYKADLWRYCVLYKKGGIYLDIKYQCEPGFKLIELTDKEYYVLERPYINTNISIKKNIKMINKYNYLKNIDKTLWINNIGIYNALIVCKPKNKLIFQCIQQCIQNIKNNFYGYNFLHPTGPSLIGDIFNKYFSLKNIELFYSLNGIYILNKNRAILKQYDEYYKKENKSNYKIQWNNKNIYNT
jgi:mannosyltransferase OCH1-like enzyme